MKKIRNVKKQWRYPCLKFNLKMRLSALFILAAFFGTYANNGYSQKKITLKADNVTIAKVIDEIEATTSYKFVYNTRFVNLERRVSIDVKRAAVETVLKKLFDKTGTVYEIKEGQVILTFKEAEESIPEEIPETKATVQQYRTISGTITNAVGEPIMGVNIIVKGTNRGTFSDHSGYYTIEVKDDDIVQFSYIGYKAVEEHIDEQDIINVQMQEDVMALGEVEVNAGYWTVKEREKTGNISRITAEDIGKQPVANPLQALQGRMSGVQVTQQSGVPGGNFTVRVRGQNSVRTEIGVNEPLYIVDGVPFPSVPLSSPGISEILSGSISPFNSIDPSNIASIEVLKDADATAIYGSRGANGVVLITTKKGKEGKSQVNININSGIGRVSRRLNLLNTEQYLEMRYEGFANDNAETFLENPDFYRFFPDLKLWDSNRYTDWQKELIGGSAYFNNAQASLSGGNSNTQYLVRGSYFRQTTVFPGDNADTRISGHFNFSHTTPNQKFKTTLAVSYTNDNINILSQDLTALAITLPPNAPALYDDKGQINWEDSTWENPLAFLEREYQGVTDNFIANATLEYRLLPGLHISSRLGYTNMQVSEDRIEPLRSVVPTVRVTRTGASFFSNSNLKTWIVEPQITYKRGIGQGNLDILVGGTWQQSINNSLQIIGTGYTNDLLIRNIQAAPNITINQSGYIQYRYNAVFGRINYNWKGKYFVNLTGRRDGSSRFGPGNRFGNFGAVGAAWTFSEEEFTPGFISFGKLRGSYGTTGSDAIGNYQYLDTYSSTQYPYSGQSGLIPTRLANPNFGWETNKKLEAGLELGFVKDRILFSGSWYRNRSSNQLVGFPLPIITGQSTIQFNLPATVENKGWEFELSTTNIQTDHFSWRSGFNISFPENTLLDYPNIEASPFANRYRVGKSLFIAPGFHFMGVDPEAGIYTFEDVNGNGVGTDFPEDLQFLKEISQQYYGGFQNTIRYKSFELDIFLQFVKQAGRNFLSSFPPPGTQSNQPVGVMGRWQNLGDESDIQKFTVISSEASQAYFSIRGSDGSIEDASFIRLTNLSLSWNLPKRLGLGTQSKLYLQGQNLFTITGYSGLDPETLSSTRLPPLRVLTLGIQLSF